MKFTNLSLLTFVTGLLSFNAHASVMTFEMEGFNYYGLSTIIHEGSTNGFGAHQWKLDDDNAGNSSLTTIYDDLDHNGLSNGDTLSSTGAGVMHFNGLNGNADAKLTWNNLDGTLGNGAHGSTGHNIESLTFDWELEWNDGMNDVSFSDTASFSHIGGSGTFNQVQMDSDSLSFYLWGAFSPDGGTDFYSGTGLGIDLTATGSKVPEPSVIALMGFGLIGLGFFRRRKS